MAKKTNKKEVPSQEQAAPQEQEVKAPVELRDGHGHTHHIQNTEKSKARDNRDQR